MLTEKDYCDYDTCVALKDLGYVGTGEECSYFGAYFNNGNDIFADDLNNNEIAVDEYLRVPLFLAQKWLREEKGIHIAPRIYLYHDINLDEHTSWECTIYVEWSAIYTIGKSLTYEDALLLGVKEAVKILKEK